MASIAPTFNDPPPTPQLLLVPRRVGNYLVAVTLNGEPILGSRFALSVSGDGAHPGSCVAAGSGLRLMVAGELGRFTVQAWDAYGNIARRRIFEPGGGAGPPLQPLPFDLRLSQLSAPSPPSPPLSPPRRRRRRSRKTSRCVYGRSRSPAAARVASPASGRLCARGAGPTISLTPRPSLCPSPPRH